MARQQIRVDADQLRLDGLKSQAERIDETKDVRGPGEELEPRASETLTPGEVPLTRAHLAPACNWQERLALLQRRLQADQAALDSFGERTSAEKERLAARIARQDLRMRADKESLDELRRVQAEFGGDATAVQIGVFPSAEAAPK